MSTLAIVLVALGVLLALLVFGGLGASARRRRLDAARLRTELEEANRALALARAQDRGWERSGLEAAARGAFAARSALPIRELQLVQVVDRPGTEEDRAVFRVLTDDGPDEVELVRHGDAWRPR
jgi:type II secretory pathway pseudopilin PulG